MEGTLLMHFTELSGHAAEYLLDTGGVGGHHTSTQGLCEVTSGYDCWWGGVDTCLEVRGAPVNEADGLFLLEGLLGFVHIFW
jgi:hypothetical protein